MNFDAVIIGGGPSGSAAAIALAQQGRSVAIVEKSVFPRRKVCGEFISVAGLDLLDELGLGGSIDAQAGPEVRRLALFAGGGMIEAEMPRGRRRPYGRALGRHLLDLMLLERARALGATVLQPAKANRVRRSGDLMVVESEGAEPLAAPVVIAAHGSWEAGELPSQLRLAHRSGDLLAFKARFSGATLPSGLMPLLAFPGGYGGMVWSDSGCVSLSCCIRRDVLGVVRTRYSGASAGAAVFEHIRASCRGVAEALEGARLEGDWLGAGPIRPGIRTGCREGMLCVGNVAGESHPIIAEGISMALQSGWMLADELCHEPRWDPAAVDRVGRRYGQQWRRQFSLRIRAAEGLYQLASRPVGARLMERAVGLFPALLPVGARISGKSAGVFAPGTKAPSP